jgi:Ca-activated chloride channel family protein
LVHFDNDAHILLPLTKLDGSDREFLTTKARELLNYSGGTRLEKALVLIKAHLSESSASVKKVIILTDGETTDEDACINLARDLSKSGIGIICIGLGSEYKEDFLSVLVDQTNGFLYHLSETEDSLTGLQDALWEALILAEKEHLTRVRLDFDLNPGTQLHSLSRVYPMVQNIPSTEMGLWKVGNVGTGNEISLISELILPQHGVGHFNVGQVIATYDIPSRQLFDQTYIQPLTVTFTTDKEATTSLDEDVVFLARQVRMSQLAERAVNEAQSGQIQPAMLSLQELGDLSAEVGNPLVSQIVQRASIELDTNQQLAPLTIKEIKIGSKTKTLLPPSK